VHQIFYSGSNDIPVTQRTASSHQITNTAAE